jgi:hypothetical protein
MSIIWLVTVTLFEGVIGIGVPEPKPGSLSKKYSILVIERLPGATDCLTNEREFVRLHRPSVSFALTKKW